MTLRQWLTHFRHWLACFPTRNDHNWIAAFGEPDETCLVCDARQQDPDWTPEDRERAQEFYRKNPHLRDDLVTCLECGAEMIEGMCPECGEEREDDD